MISPPSAMIYAPGCTMHPSPKWMLPYSSALVQMTVVGVFLVPWTSEALVRDDWLVVDMREDVFCESLSWSLLEASMDKLGSAILTIKFLKSLS